VRDLGEAADRLRRELERCAFGREQRLVLLDEVRVRRRQDPHEILDAERV
jgi:hypothetical protein